MIRSSKCLQVSHQHSLNDVVLSIVDRGVSGVFSGAGATSYSMREIAESISRALGQRRLMIAASPTIMLAACTVAEKVGLSIPFRSDSIRSLQSGPTSEVIEALRTMNISFPELDSPEWVTAVRGTTHRLV